MTIKLSELKLGDIVTVTVTGEVTDNRFGDGLIRVGDRFIRGLYIGHDDVIAPDVSIISRTPTKPAWHNAKVIKATHKGRTGLFLKVEAADVRYLVWKSEFAYGLYQRDAESSLEDVEIIVP